MDDTDFNSNNCPIITPTFPSASASASATATATAGATLDPNFRVFSGLSSVVSREPDGQSSPSTSTSAVCHSSSE